MTSAKGGSASGVSGTSLLSCSVVSKGGWRPERSCSASLKHRLQPDVCGVRSTTRSSVRSAQHWSMGWSRFPIWRKRCDLRWRMVGGSPTGPAMLWAGCGVNGRACDRSVATNFRICCGVWDRVFKTPSWLNATVVPCWRSRRGLWGRSLDRSMTARPQEAPCSWNPAPFSALATS